MPELPDICVYCDAIENRIRGEKLLQIILSKPFFLRSVEPTIESVIDLEIHQVHRLGKRVVIELAGEYFLVIHLMVAGRFQWSKKPSPTKRPIRNTLAQLRFSSGTLSITEAGSKKRASLYVVQGHEQLQRHDPGGLELMSCDLGAFTARIRRENRTLKRALTDPRIFSGVGNAYSDEILHAAGLSPVKLSSRLSDDEIEQLFTAARATLGHWLELLTNETRLQFPKKVTAFRPDMAVHGRYQLPCPTCGCSIQRIRYVSNETNYCPACQTDGKLLADRALSRLLKKDWPKTVEDLEQLRPNDNPS